MGIRLYVLGKTAKRFISDSGHLQNVYSGPVTARVTLHNVTYPILQKFDFLISGSSPLTFST